MTENERLAFGEEMEKLYGIKVAKDDPLIPALALMQEVMKKITIFDAEYNKFYEMQGNRLDEQVNSLLKAIKANDKAFEVNQRELIETIRNFIKGQNAIYSRMGDIIDLQNKLLEKKKRRFLLF